MPSITIREYHPETGMLLGNISAINFGNITAGTHSRVKVVDIAFEGISAVGNIKLGIVSTGGISVTSGEIGHFGITSSSSFDASLASQPIEYHFKGINTTANSSNENNESIPNKTSTTSNYIYLDIEIGATNYNAGNGAYKIFFDYA